MRRLAAAGFLILLMGASGCVTSRSDCAAPCHEYPPVSGAHLSHTGGDIPMTCDLCHGEGAAFGLQPGHRDRTPTLLGETDYESSHGPRPAWYGSVWGEGAAFDGYDESSSVCSGLACHGLDTVGWTQKAGAALYNGVCRGCHDITPASVQMPGQGLMVTASSAAANYEGPISGFSRGGHGDTTINDPAWFRDCAPGRSLPLPCVACHDDRAPHFPPAVGNPYRMTAAALSNTLPGADPGEPNVTNLCTQTGCHPKVLGTGSYGFLTAIKHPSGLWPITAPEPDVVLMDYPQASINSEAPGSSTDPALDPAGRLSPVGLSIDRYVDHWAYMDPDAPATADTTDDEPFLPLGDPLLKSSGDVFDNEASDAAFCLIVCTTCHNPHGTDLHVPGQTPGVWSSIVDIPANKMLRLRDQDGELCDACHGI